jgi:hypothetical protein
MSDTQPQWQQLVTPGHTWQARLNRITWIGALLLALFALSLVRDIHGNTIGLAMALSEANQAGDASWFERFRAEPWQTVKGTFTGRATAPTRPQLAPAIQLQPLPAGGLDPAGLTMPADLDTYIADQLNALQRTEKLSTEYPDCDPMTTLLKPWVNSRTGRADVPRCKFGADNTIWMASLISQGSPYSPPLPWLGVFHKGAAGWVYRNVDIGQRSALLNGHETIAVDHVIYQIARDFPDLIAPADSTAVPGEAK